MLQRASVQHHGQHVTLGFFLTCVLERTPTVQTQSQTVDTVAPEFLWLNHLFNEREEKSVTLLLRAVSRYVFNMMNYLLKRRVDSERSEITSVSSL